jgi:hypothetical protein
MVQHGGVFAAAAAASAASQQQDEQQGAGSGSVQQLSGMAAAGQGPSRLLEQAAAKAGTGSSSNTGSSLIAKLASLGVKGPGDPKQWVVLGIESSCDDTAAAVVRGDGTILGHRIASQVSRELSRLVKCRCALLFCGLSDGDQAVPAAFTVFVSIKLANCDLHHRSPQTGMFCLAKQDL